LVDPKSRTLVGPDFSVFGATDSKPLVGSPTTSSAATCDEDCDGMRPAGSPPHLGTVAALKVLEVEDQVLSKVAKLSPDPLQLSTGCLRRCYSLRELVQMVAGFLLQAAILGIVPVSLPHDITIGRDGRICQGSADD
jgi:hypothetical protein